MAVSFDYKAARAFTDVFSNYVFCVLHLQSHVALPHYSTKKYISERCAIRGQGPSSGVHSCMPEIFVLAFLGPKPCYILITAITDC